MAAVTRHIWLMLTLRHDLNGLPHQSFGLVCIIFMASAIVAAWRWSNPFLLPAHLAILLCMARVTSIRFASAYALLSIGIEGIAIPVEAMTGWRGGFMPFGAWELAGFSAAFWRELKRRDGHSESI